MYLEKPGTLHKPSLEPVSTSSCCSRKHGRREHSADRASLRHSSRISHYALGRASHHIIASGGPPPPPPPTARISSNISQANNNNNNTTGRTVTIAGNESDSGFSSTNHTPKDYLLMESVARLASKTKKQMCNPAENHAERTLGMETLMNIEPTLVTKSSS